LDLPASEGKGANGAAGVICKRDVALYTGARKKSHASPIVAVTIKTLRKTTKRRRFARLLSDCSSEATAGSLESRSRNRPSRFIQDTSLLRQI
jgi:hypothetical protein